MLAKLHCMDHGSWFMVHGAQSELWVQCSCLLSGSWFLGLSRSVRVMFSCVGFIQRQTHLLYYRMATEETRMVCSGMRSFMETEMSWDFVCPDRRPTAKAEAEPKPKRRRAVCPEHLEDGSDGDDPADVSILAKRQRRRCNAALVPCLTSAAEIVIMDHRPGPAGQQVRCSMPAELADLQGIAHGIDMNFLAQHFTINSLFTRAGHAFHMPSPAKEVVAVLLSSL